jgi:hypothetical protein
MGINLTIFRKTKTKKKITIDLHSDPHGTYQELMELEDE